jgi:hypothetical protein
MKEAYDSLKQGIMASSVVSKQGMDERRENADIICLQLLVYLLEQRNYDGFIK